jgi:hypothetical protein
MYNDNVKKFNSIDLNNTGYVRNMVDNIEKKIPKVQYFDENAVVSSESDDIIPIEITQVNEPVPISIKKSQKLEPVDLTPTVGQSYSLLSDDDYNWVNVNYSNSFQPK